MRRTGVPPRPIFFWPREPLLRGKMKAAVLELAMVDGSGWRRALAQSLKVLAGATGGEEQYRAQIRPRLYPGLKSGPRFASRVRGRVPS